MKKIIFIFLFSLVNIPAFTQANTYFHDRIDTTIFAVADTVGHGANNYFATNTNNDFNVKQYVNGLSINILFKKGTTGSGTLTLITKTGTLSTKSIKKENGQALIVGDILDSTTMLVTFSGNSFRIRATPNVTSPVGITPILHGGTNQTTLITVPTASAIPSWDGNKNFSANNLITTYTTIATAASTTTLTAASPSYIYFTGSTTQTVQLPVTSTLITSINYFIKNKSTKSLIVNSSGGNAVATIYPNNDGIFQCIGTTHTTAVDWGVSNRITNNMFMYKALIPSATFIANIAGGISVLTTTTGAQQGIYVMPGSVFIRTTGGTTNYTFSTSTALELAAGTNSPDIEFIYFPSGGTSLTTAALQSIPNYISSSPQANININAGLSLISQDTPISGNRDIIISFLYFIIDLN